MFSTTDGMALEVFVVEGWPGDEVSSCSSVPVQFTFSCETVAVF